MNLDAGLWLRAGGALLAVLALAWLVSAGLRRGGLANRPGRRLKLEESLALDARRRLLLLRCDGREFLLLTGGAQELLIAPPPEPPA